MYVELLASDNYISVNRKLAQLFDLKTAVYIAELTNIITKVVKKKTVDKEGFFVVNRNYIEERTTISIEDQLICDSILTKVGVLDTSKDDVNKIRMDIELLTSLIANEDAKLLGEVAKKCKVSKVKKSEAKVQAIRQSLKASVTEDDKDILNALYGWIDSILDSKNFLSKNIIEIFQKQLSDYTSDKNTKLAIITVATIQAYKDVTWAIRSYERNNTSAMPKRDFSRVAPKAKVEVSNGYAEGVEF